ncbi:MAG: inositol monophosphatase family protein [Pirellulaceae bacterium]
MKTTIDPLFLQIATEAARKAGKYQLEQLGKITIREKNPGDVVTEADIESQKIIFSLLSGHFPEHSLLGEESGENQTDWRKGYCWIVDPIDGTKNFVHGLPSFSVSIALFLDGEPVVGVVYDPMLDELFTAELGNGARKNGRPIGPSECVELRRSLLVCSFPSVVTSETPELARFVNVVQKASLRRLGSAALNLCYVASGRLDGYWASTLNIWDVAAGALIVLEAGAVLRGLDGTPFSFLDCRLAATSTDRLNQELVPLLDV